MRLLIKNLGSFLMTSFGENWTPLVFVSRESCSSATGA